MGGIEGVRFVPLTTTGGAPTDAVSRMLLSGAVLRGRIAADGALLNLVVAGQHVPLPKSVALAPGTAVEVQLAHDSGTPQLRLRVLDSPAQPALFPPNSTPSAPTPTPIPPALAELLKPEQIAALLPKVVALPAKAIEALLHVFVTRPEAGRALVRLVSLLSVEIAEGRLPAAAGAPVDAAAQTMKPESPEEFRRALDLARELIGAERGGASQARPNARSILADLAQLRDALSERQASVESRAPAETMKAVDAFLDKLSNATLQNVRALDTPYQFLTMPFAPGTGIDHAQVHLIGRERRGGGGGGDREAHQVALDLHLTHLGALWITLQSAGPACNCVIRVRDPAVRGAIDQASSTLEDALRRAGFSAAQVRTQAWNGDRADAAAAWLAQTGRFEAEA